MARKRNQESLPEVPSHWEPYATFGDFPTYGGIIYRNGSGYGMLLGREGEGPDDIWVWVVDDATDKLALQDYDLDDAAEYVGIDPGEMRKYAQSDDPVVLANVWQAVADHGGYLDLYGDPDWSGPHDDIWNAFADDYNRANSTPKTNAGGRGFTQKEIRAKLDILRKRSHMKDPQAYLQSTEHYDASPKGETKADWVREAASAHGYEPYIVEYNFGSAYTSAAVVVLAGHPDEALQTADEWWCTRYYDSDTDACDEARGSGEGVISVRPLMEEAKANPRPRKNNPTAPVTPGLLVGRLKF